MFGWYRELLNIIHENRQKKANLAEQLADRKNICPSCEVLKMELERTNIEKRLLLDRLLHVKEELPPPIAPPISLPQTRHIPWSVKKQALEAEDRQRANAMKAAARPDNTVEDLERELDAVQEERENNG